MTPSSNVSRLIRLALAALVGLGATLGSASAQSKPVTVTAAIDFPTVYFFRGIRQETDPKFTTFLAGDVGISLLSDGTGGVSSAGLNVGTWNALLTGSSGSDGPADGVFYESDFYAGLTLGMSNGISVTPMYTAYTSPNDMFSTVHEISFKVAHGSRYAPYGLLAFEVGGDGQADGGQLSGGDRGVYLELGIGPSWSIAGGKATVGVPIKVGLSLKDYYEMPVTLEDSKFGYIDGGVLFTVPLSGITAGSWNVHGGVNFLGFGDTLGAFNADPDTGESRKGWVTASAGIGISF